MNQHTDAPVTPMPVDDEHAAMLAYARGAECAARIARAQAEIDAGWGLWRTMHIFKRGSIAAAVLWR